MKDFYTDYGSSKYSSKIPKVLAFRFHNFMGFVDSKWINLMPITLLFGRNSTGKSAIIRALLLLRQSLNATLKTGPFLFTDERGIDLGTFGNFIHKHDESLPLSFRFKIELPSNEDYPEAFRIYRFKINGETLDTDFVTLNLVYRLDSATSFIQILELSIFGTDDDENEDKYKIISLKRQTTEPQKERFSHAADNLFWLLESSFFEPDHQARPWKNCDVVQHDGFLARIDLPGAGDMEINDDQQDNPNYEAFNKIAGLLRYLRTEIIRFLRTFTYLGPIREEPQRFYYIPQHKFGQSAISRFVRRKDDKNYEDRINAWLDKSTLNVRLRIKQVTDELGNKLPLYQVTIKERNDDQDDFESNIRDVGYGLSQLLPVLVESFFVEEERLVIIEQPELHLHPAAQVWLGDLFIQMSHLGTRFLLETHSEHLLLRFQTKIAETSAGESFGLDAVRNKSVMAYFVERQRKRSFTQPVHFNKFGEYEQVPAGFRDFFADDLHETWRRSRAARQARKQENQQGETR